MKKALLAVLILACSISLHAQQKQALTASATSCTVSSTACLVYGIDQTMGGATFTVGSNSGGNTLQFEASGDGGSTWVALNVTQSNSTTSVTSTTGTGTWQANVAGYTTVRIRCSTFVSGSAVVSIITSIASARSGGGSGSSGPGWAGAVTCSTVNAFVYWLSSSSGACDSHITTNSGAGTLTVANAGTFTTGTQSEYLQSLLNSCSPATEFFANHAQQATDAVAGCGAMPMAGTNQVNGVAGYANTSGSTATGGYFQCRPLVNNSFCDGVNGVVQDLSGNTTGVTIQAFDADVYPLNASSAYTTVGAYSAALAGPSGFHFGNAFLCEQFGSFTGLWGTCFDTANSVTTIGLNLGIRDGAGPGVTSQGIQWNYKDSGGTGHQIIGYVDTTGALNYPSNFTCGALNSAGCVITQFGSTSGSFTHTVNSTATIETVNGDYLFPAGTASIPAVSFVDGSNGFFRQVSDVLSYASGSADTISMYNAGFRIVTGASYQWSNSSSSSTGSAADTNISRAAAGVVAIGTSATAGDETGTLITATVRANTGFSANGTAGTSAGPFTAVTSIQSTEGLVTTLTGTSDARLKMDVHPFLRGLTDVMKLHPATYRWNEKGQEITKFSPDVRQAGFIAQDVQAAIPEAVGTESHDGIEYLTFTDRVVLATLVNAIQQEEKQIKALKVELAKLKAEKSER